MFNAKQEPSGRIIKSRAESSYYCPNKECEWVEKGGSDTPWKRGMGCGFARAMNIPQTNKLVWELVTSLHAKSSTLKEEVKNRMLKESGIKIRRLQKYYGSMSETLGNLEANKLIGKKWATLRPSLPAQGWSVQARLNLVSG